MSNNAVAAYEDGKMPAAKIAAALRARGYRVNGAWVAEHFMPSEWHHTSAKFNETKFYDLAEIEAKIEANSEHYAAAAAEFLMAAKAAKAEASYIADVSVTDWIEERVHCGYFRGRSRGMRTVNRPHTRILKAVTVRTAGATMIEIEGEGMRKASNCQITRLDAAEIKRRKNLASAAKRTATIAARKAAAAVQAELAKAAVAIATAMASPTLALPAPARLDASLEGSGIDSLRHFLEARYNGGRCFNNKQRGEIYKIAARVIAKVINIEAACDLVAELAKSWAAKSTN